MTGTVSDRYDDLRIELCEFCRENESCRDCVLNIPDVRCGRGTHFMRKWRDRNMTDEEIIEAYEIVFGTKTEAQDIEPLSDADFDSLFGGAL